MVAEHNVAKDSISNDCDEVLLIRFEMLHNVSMHGWLLQLMSYHGKAKNLLDEISLSMSNIVLASGAIRQNRNVFLAKNLQTVVDYCTFDVIIKVFFSVWHGQSVVLVEYYMTDPQLFEHSVVDMSRGLCTDMWYESLPIAQHGAPKHSDALVVKVLASFCTTHFYFFYKF